MRAFLEPPIEGVVLETYGSGNGPDSREELLEEIRAAAKRGVIIVNCTQCLYGHVVDSYATGRVRRIPTISFRDSRSGDDFSLKYQHTFKWTGVKKKENHNMYTMPC